MRRVLLAFALAAALPLSSVELTALVRPAVTYLQDTFTGANSTAIETRAMDSGDNWTVTLYASNEAGCATAYDIQSNRSTLGGTSNFCVYASDAGQADVTYSFDLIIPNATDYLACGVVRYTSINNFYVVCIERDGGGTPYLMLSEWINTSFTSRNTENMGGGTTNSTQTITVTTSGNAVTAVVTGTGEDVTYSHSNNASATYFGIMGYNDGTYVAGAVDNVLVTDGGGGGGPTINPAIINAPIRGGGLAEWLRRLF